MATIVTRAGKGSPLTNTEVDANFTNLNTDKAELSGAAFTGAITTTSTVDGRDVATDGSKLDGIEASADVTDTTNVTAAGALMDSEVTNLAQVKAFDSADYATAAQGTTADAALPRTGGAMTGSITTNSTFDGRDVAADGTKLDGIEASADVTDATNVTAAGALMDSELTDIASVKALDQGVATTDSPTFAGITLATADINSGTIDGTTIGASSASTGAFTTLTATGAFTSVGIDDNATSTAITIDSSENVGIGVVPKTWYSASTALEIGSMSFEDYGVSGANVSVFANNLYRNTSNAYVYKESDFAASYSQYNGEHTFNTAPSGTADSAATLTTVMKIDSSGNVGMGTASPTLASAWNKVLHVQSAGAGSSIRLADSASGTSGEVGLLMGQYSNSSYIINRDSSNMYFWTGGQERVRLDSAGNLLVGTTDDVVWNNSANSAADNGHNLRDDGRAGFAYYNATANSNATVNINRTGSDGDLIRLFKSGTNVGSIGTVSGDIRIGGLDDNHASIRFAASSKAVLPVKNSDGGLSDNTTDLGASNARFKDLYLSGKVQASYIYRADASGAGLHFTTNAIYPTNETTALSDGNESLGAAAYRFKDLYLSGGAIVGAGSSSAPSITASNDTDAGLFWGGGFLGFTGGSGNQMRLDASGNLLVGTTSAGTQAAGGVAIVPASDSLIRVGHANGTGSGSKYMQFSYNQSEVGSITQHGTSQVLFNVSSDQRLKENIADADDAGSKVDAIQVRKFDWKADGSHQDYGMIAQELQTVAPEAVSGDADSEDMMGVDYSKLVPMLIKEIQSLRNRVAQLEA